MRCAFVALISAGWIGGVGQTQELRAPLHRVLELKRGESQEIVLANSKRVTIRLLDLEETRDPWRSAIRRSRVKVVAGDREAWVEAGNYHLPVTLGDVQIDCTITSGYTQNCDEDYWGLAKDKDARLRVWLAASPWVEPGTFVYPLKQRWFASATQMSNEPSFVDTPERISVQKIYYHSGLDIGGCEGMTEVVAACDGVVVAAGPQVVSGAKEEEPWMIPGYWPNRYPDQVCVLDDRGWVASYVHLKTVEVRPGQKVRRGERIGLLGKEGGTLWSHLHFEIRSRQPSGRWGTEDGYAMMWEAYQREHVPPLRAVARPHRLVAIGEKTTLEGDRSWSLSGKITRYDWTFTDGSTALGAKVERRYGEPGTYSEILKLIDSEGHVDYDFAVVQVMDPAHPNRLPPTIHASYFPTLGIGPGDTITFKVLTFGATDGEETWDFGDGSPFVRVTSGAREKPQVKAAYAETVHRYDKPGHYLVKVERAGLVGSKAVAHLSVRVEKNP